MAASIRSQLNLAFSARCEHSNSELESMVLTETAFVENSVMLECLEGIVKESSTDVIAINSNSRIMCSGKS